MIVEHKFFIGTQYVDKDLKLKNSSLLCMFEDMAGMHGIIAGESLRDAPTTWVLTAYRVVVKKRPGYGDYVTVRTWPRETRNYFACREFEIFGENGESLVCAISEWAHINRADGRLEKATPELAAAYDPEPERTAFGGFRIHRLREPENTVAEREQFIDWNWIDPNNHMNNVYYLELAEMTLPDEVRRNFQCDVFEIFYRKEIKHGDTVNCRLSDEDGSYIVSVRSLDGSILHAQIKLEK